MGTIYKYPLKIVEYQKLYTFKTFKPLCIQVQNNDPVLWALVDTESAPTIRKVILCGTGQEITHDINNYPHLGSVQVDGLVWHYFLNPIIITEINH